MPTDNAIRASDGDRERTIGILREAYALGRLTLAEFDERTTAALAGRTWGDLRALTQDLPAGTGPPSGHTGPRTPVARPVPPAPAAPAAPPARPASERVRLLPVLLIALFWLAMSLWARAGAALIPVVFLLLIAMQSAGRRRCGPGARPRPPRPGWRDPSQRPGGQA